MMKIEALYVYPIKSLRGISLPSAALTQRGIPHDRHFMLLKVHRDGTSPTGQPEYENMHVSHHPQLCLFTTAFAPPHPADPTEIIVAHTDPSSASKSTLAVPLRPDTAGLQRVEVSMHQSDTKAFAMPAVFSEWFAARLGFEVVLAILGEGDGRSVLGNIAPNAGVRNAVWQERRRREMQTQGSWAGRLAGMAPGWLSGDGVGGEAREEGEEGYSVTFADCAPFLVASTASLEDFSRRFKEEDGMDVTKCRPNILVSGAREAWEEDFWGEVVIESSAGNEHREKRRRDGSRNGERVSRGTAGAGLVLQLTANCVRCPSLNVDFKTGSFGKGEKGQALKKLQSDRRVDAGQKFSPVFGRYGFMARDQGCDTYGNVRDARVVNVGDAVIVGKRNAGRTVFRWPGMGGLPKEDLYPVS